MQVLDLAELAEQLLQVLLASFLVHVGDQDDPAFDGANGDGARGRTRFGRGISSRRCIVDVHLGRHDERLMVLELMVKYLGKVGVGGSESLGYLSQI